MIIPKLIKNIMPIIVIMIVTWSALLGILVIVNNILLPLSKGMVLKVMVHILSFILLLTWLFLWFFMTKYYVKKCIGNSNERKFTSKY